MTLRQSPSYLVAFFLLGSAAVGCGSANASSSTNVSAAPGAKVNVQTTNNAIGGSPTVSPNTSLQPTIKP